jgi:hypothetical protein
MSVRQPAAAASETRSRLHVVLSAGQTFNAARAAGPRAAPTDAAHDDLYKKDGDDPVRKRDEYYDWLARCRLFGQFLSANLVPKDAATRGALPHKEDGVTLRASDNGYKMRMLLPALYKFAQQQVLQSAAAARAELAGIPDPGMQFSLLEQQLEEMKTATDGVGWQAFPRQDGRELSFEDKWNWLAQNQRLKAMDRSGHLCIFDSGFVPFYKQEYKSWSSPIAISVGLWKEDGTPYAWNDPDVLDAKTGQPVTFAGELASEAQYMLLHPTENACVFCYCVASKAEAEAKHVPWPGPNPEYSGPSAGPGIPAADPLARPYLYVILVCGPNRQLEERPPDARMVKDRGLGRTTPLDSSASGQQLFGRITELATLLGCVTVTCSALPHVWGYYERFYGAQFMDTQGSVVNADRYIYKDPTPPVNRDRANRIAPGLIPVDADEELKFKRAYYKNYWKPRNKQLAAQEEAQAKRDAAEEEQARRAAEPASDRPRRRARTTYAALGLDAAMQARMQEARPAPHELD